MARRIAYRANRVAEIDLDWDVEQLLADLDAGVDLSGLWDKGGLDKLLNEIIEEEQTGPEDIPLPMDIFWPTDNEFDLPTLDANMQATNLIMPCLKWGTVARTKNAKQMPGTRHFYTEDYKFNALWIDPRPVVRSGCASVIEPNFSTNEQMPLAVGLWHIYRKRWLARWWQFMGIRIFVDLNVSPKFAQYNLMGVPAGWRAYATRLYMDAVDLAIADFALACERAGTSDVLFVAYGGRERTAGKLAKSRGWLFVEEDSIAARR